ncbi:N-acetylneuraminate synthase [Falsibacillus pallidus]|uniref:N-acetylneuraminate synthase n=1 Tax=Falsibacillus pallidus TaxID=493781 RepID=A0A370GW03_9BACI|nr:N-acetylneuraminate synthase [Falsibacillus pallidus]RDI47721.1 N-acetylneuraminate synthase [Falsibacillus pallidus]
MINIGRRIISEESPAYIIAEAGVNHNGSIEMAEKLIKAAYDAGADAVKFQTFKSELLVSKSARKADYQLTNESDGENQFDMLKGLELTYEEFHHLQRVCNSIGIEFLSTPFDLESAQFLNKLGLHAFKIGSGDLTNLPLLTEIGAFQKPVLLSTGMSNLAEIEEAIHSINHPAIALFHCTSSYPAPHDELNLLSIQSMKHAFQKIVGYSDHTSGIEAAVSSVSIGAKIIEKHITLDQLLPGPDHKASLSPEQFAEYTAAIRRTEKMLGDGKKRCMPSEENTRTTARKSIIASLPLSSGDILSPDTLSIKRPGSGIPPKYLPLVIGRKINKDKQADDPVDWHDLS